MAFVVLMTTMSFAVDLHYCGETMVDFSFVHEVETCGMEKMLAPQPCESTISEKSCCSDEQIVMDGHNDLKTSYHSLTFEQQTFIASFFYSYINSFEESDVNIVPFKAYSPPFLIRDVQILHETYLI